MPISGIKPGSWRRPTLRPALVNVGRSHGLYPPRVRFSAFQKHMPLNTELKETESGDYCTGLLHAFYNTIHTSLLNINEMEYQLVQSICEWVRLCVLY